MRILVLLMALMLGLAPVAMAADVTTYKLQVNGAGSDGSAAGSSTSAMLPGYLEDVYLDYASDAPPTTDVTLTFGTRGGTILAVANYATDILLAPRIKPVDNASASISNAYDRFPLWDKVTATLAQSSASTPAVTVYLRVSRP